MKRLPFALLYATSLLALDQPKVVNAKLQTHAVNGPLAAEVKKLVESDAGPVWIGYSVPIAGEHHSCCYYSDGGISFRGCGLEGSQLGMQGGIPASGPVQLEAPKEAVILMRAENRQLEKIRTFTSDCDLDAGGTPFHWLTGVKADDSVAYLQSLAGSGYVQSDVGRSAVGAIAVHQGSLAQSVLEKFISPDQPDSIRRRAIDSMAWRGRPGFDVLSRLVKNDADERTREEAIRALALTKQPDALQLIRQASTNDKSGRVRGEALAVLARYDPATAGKLIQNAIDTDADKQVRRRAMAALTQLPPEQGIPMLIALARGTKDAEIRRESMQMLGRSRDPRAQRFIEEVLK